MMANDAACIWMPHYHEFALIQYLNASLSLSISFSLSLSVPPHSLTSMSYSLHTSPIFTFSHCPSLICKTAHLARHREWWEEMSHSTASSRPPHWNVNWPTGVGVEGWRDGGMNGRRSGGWQEWPCSIVCFLKTWRFLMIILIPSRTSQPKLGALSPLRSLSLIKTQSQATNSNKPSTSSLKERGGWKCRLQ